MYHPLLEIEVYRPLEFAKLLGLSAPTIITWLKQQKLKGRKLGGRYYVVATELERLRT